MTFGILCPVLAPLHWSARLFNVYICNSCSTHYVKATMHKVALFRGVVPRMFIVDIE